MPENNRPFWMDLVPDIRAWASAGMFVIVFYLLHLIAAHPELKENELFKTVATLLLGSGGFGLVCAFLWGGSRASASAVETVNQVARNASAQPQSAPVASASPLATADPAQPPAAEPAP